MDTVKITLLKPHTHAGTAWPAGTELEVSPADADFLLRLRVIGKKTAVPTIKSPAKTTKEATHG